MATKLSKDWFAAAARGIYNVLNKERIKYDSVILKKLQDDFWETADGIAISALKEKYSLSCQTSYLTFNLSSYLKYAPFSTPATTVLVDELILKAPYFSDSDSHIIIEQVQKVYLEKLEEYYLKKYNYTKPETND